MGWPRAMVVCVCVYLWPRLKMRFPGMIAVCDHVQECVPHWVCDGWDESMRAAPPPGGGNRPLLHRGAEQSGGPRGWTRGGLPTPQARAVHRGPAPPRPAPLPPLRSPSPARSRTLDSDLSPRAQPPHTRPPLTRAGSSQLWFPPRRPPRCSRPRWRAAPTPRCPRSAGRPAPGMRAGRTREPGGGAAGAREGRQTPPGPGGPRARPLLSWEHRGSTGGGDPGTQVVPICQLPRRGDFPLPPRPHFRPLRPPPRPQPFVSLLPTLPRVAALGWEDPCFLPAASSHPLVRVSPVLPLDALQQFISPR